MFSCLLNIRPCTCVTFLVTKRVTFTLHIPGYFLTEEILPLRNFTFGKQILIWDIFFIKTSTFIKSEIRNTHVGLQLKTFKCAPLKVDTYHTM